MNPTQPETSAEALQLAQFREWLEQPMTRLFFRQLEKDRIELLTAASISSAKTGNHNTTEHNRLVQALQTLKILNTYARSSKYPFTVKPGPTYSAD